MNKGEEHHTHEHPIHEEHKQHDVTEQMTLVQLAHEIKEPTVERISSDEREPVKKCCKVSEQVRCACHCCLRSWSLSLNACEGCCAISSAACIFMSTLAMGCNKCLEQMDCDGH
jgi:hypothetical protein